VAVGALPLLWLDLLGRPVPETTRPLNWDERFDRCVGQRRRGRLREGERPMSQGAYDQSGLSRCITVLALQTVGPNGRPRSGER
jgi:hypothetical protein